MIVVVALVVLGPEKLPGAARQIGNVLRQVRKISTGFQQELQNALDEPIEAEARQRGQLAVENSLQGSSPGNFEGEVVCEAAAVENSLQGSSPGNEESKTQPEQTSDPPPSSQ